MAHPAGYHLDGEDAISSSNDPDGYAGDDYLPSSQRKRRISVGFEVLTAVSMKIAVFWGLATCSLI
jgi:hypothetical protein